jgi:glycosyltransferase involved in cell wall biosynthesis
MTGARPRVLLAVTAAGSLRLLSGFPKFLVDQGWDVHIVTAPGTSLDKLADEPGIATHPIPMRREPSPLADLVALCRWVIVVFRVRPDVLCAGTPKAGLLGAVSGWICRVPARIYVLRGLRLETASGLKRAVLTLTERVAMHAAHRVLCVSPSLLDEAVRRRLTPRERGVVLGRGSSNGVDMARFDPSNFPESEIRRLRNELGLSPDVPVLGYVGRVQLDKGIGVLADARAILAQRGVDHQLLIVGGTDGTDAGAALELLRRTGRRPVETGDVEDVRIYYGLMDVLCLPTLREGFPNVVLEAAASSVPTVTTDATGAVDSVIDGVTGLRAAVGSSSDLARQIERIIRDPVLRRELGREARTFVAEHFDRVGVWRRTADFLAAMRPAGAAGAGKG